jgi:hypothetical protein
MIEHSNYRTAKKDFSSSVIHLDPGEKLYLTQCMQSELNFYNLLVDNFTSVYGRDPGLLTSITEEQIELFGDLCAYSLTTHHAKNSVYFNNHKKELLEHISERLSIIFEVAKNQVAIVPDTKKHMAIEILKFFVTQAKIKKEKRIGSIDQEYKVNLNTLEKYTSMQKRHLQVRRSVCKIDYDPKENKSTLTVPYLKHPIAVFEDTDLNKSKWSIVIIHQQPGIIPKQNSDWVVDFKTVNYNYLLKYLDRKFERR